MNTRREFLIASTLTIGSFVISTGLSGCGGGGASNISASFNHGVASGDPLNDRVILWTRATPDTDVDSFSIYYEVATDITFKNLVRKAEYATVKKSSDYTLKVDFQNLEAGTTYYYRFGTGDKVSDVGITKTLPTVASKVKMAVFSCANYPKGYFNVYTEAAKTGDLDVTLHLGDYIYEYGMFNKDGSPAYATENAVNIGRELPADNNTELYDLNEYRKRYALYRTDAGTRSIHAVAPMIAVWDDHEVANDTYKDGAQNHDEATEGSFSSRKLAALQAYFEWMPIRPVSDTDKETIYRSFDFGQLVSLHMLDTRIIGRDKQLKYSDYPEMFTQGDSSNFLTDLTSQNRTIMGTTQLQWLQGQLASSNATWQVLGQQVLMGRMQLPAELLGLIGQLEGTDASTKDVILAQLNTLMGELAVIKSRILQNDPTLTPQESARVLTTLPYNLDAWDGYFYERETILNTALQLDKNLVVLAGDTHNSWASNLYALDSEQKPTIAVGVEFATSSVSSPGMEEYVGLSTQESASQFEQVISLLIDNLEYFNSNNRGFMTVTFTDTQAISQWTYVDTIDNTSYETMQQRNKQLKVTPSTNKIETIA